MRRLRADPGFMLVDLIVGLALFSLVLLSVYQLYVPTFSLSDAVNDQIAAQQDVRLAVDRVARALHETTTAFGRLRVYDAESGCSGAYQGCIGFVTARDADCAGDFQLVGGSPNWQATVYLWRDAASNELRLRCDTSTTFPATAWPPSLTPYTVVARNVVAATLTLEPAGSPAPTSITIGIEEQTPQATQRAHGPQTRFFTQTVFSPQNRLP